MEHTPDLREITPQKIDAWLQESVDIFRKSENNEAQRLAFNFSYQDKKISRFKRLTTKIYHKIKPPNWQGEPEDWLHSVLRSQPNLDLAQVLTWRGGVKNENHILISIGRSSIEATKKLNSLNLYEQYGLKTEHNTPHMSHSLSAKESFHYIFFHELGHAVYRDKTNTYNLVSGLSHLERASHYQSKHTPTDFLYQLTQIIEHAPLNVSFHSKTAFHGTLTPSIEQLQKLGLSSKDYDFYRSAHTELPVVAEEMFADCFSVIMASRANDNTHSFEETLHHVKSWREQSTTSHSHIFLYDKEQLELQADSTHYTSLALARLRDLSQERRLDIATMEHKEIVDLCQECRNYGMAAYLYELSQSSPGYHKFLTTLSEQHTLQRSLFEREATASDSAQSLELFNYLTPKDKQEIQEKVELIQKLYTQLNSMKNQPYTSIGNDLSHEISFQEPLVRLFHKQYLEQFTKQNFNTANMITVLGNIQEQTYRTWLFSRHLVDNAYHDKYTLSQQASLNSKSSFTDNLSHKISQQRTLGSETSTNNYIDNLSLSPQSLNSQHNIHTPSQQNLWETKALEPIDRIDTISPKTLTLKEKIQKLSQQPAQAALIGRPQLQKFS